MISASLLAQSSTNHRIVSDHEQREMSDCYLPHELIVEILKRLPAKSLLRFRCVRKSWSSLITSPVFIASYNNLNSTNPSTSNTQILLRNYSETLHKEIYTLHHDNTTFDIHTELEFPFTSFNPYFRIVGSCNGLICLADTLFKHKNKVILWNPSVREFLNLPSLSIQYEREGLFMSVFGFGFDCKKKDYKVVRIAIDGLSRNIRPRAEVFELSTGAWRAIDAVVPPYEMHHCWLQANLNGSVHWLAFNPSQNGGFCSLIVAFDVSDEVFREILLPLSLANEHLVDLSITVCGNCLALCHYNQVTNRRACTIWVLKEYGVGTWYKMFTIDLQQGVLVALSFRGNGEVLLATGGGELVCYSPKKKQVTNLGIRGSSQPLEFYTGSFYLDTYVQSLVFLDRVMEFQILR